MATKKDLERYVKELNNKYCKNTKNHLVINQAYGGYEVNLTGKTYKKGNKICYRKGSLGSGCSTIGNQYHDSATKTLEGLYKADSRGWVLGQVRHYERNR